MFFRTIRYLVFTLLLVSPAWADAPVSKSFLTGVAIGGIDTTSYHSAAKQGKHSEVEGNSKFEFVWQGATWRFADQEGLNKFAENPEKWVPEFNGHCANALSLGEGLIRTNGTVWQFFDDKLYLFYAERGLARWQQGDWASYRSKAELAWEELIKQ